jgi:hypothetical protein
LDAEKEGEKGQLKRIEEPEASRAGGTRMEEVDRKVGGGGEVGRLKPRERIDAERGRERERRPSGSCERWGVDAEPSMAAMRAGELKTPGEQKHRAGSGSLSLTAAGGQLALHLCHKPTRRSEATRSTLRTTRRKRRRQPRRRWTVHEALGIGEHAGDPLVQMLGSQRRARGRRG